MVVDIRGEHDSERAAMTKVAQLLGVTAPETVREWVRQAEIDAGEPGLEVLHTYIVKEELRRLLSLPVNTDR